jgi:hypothetical protein
MRRALAHGETRLERRQAQVDERARQIDANSSRLVQQTGNLQKQERAVAEQQVEMTRHLDDMRDWYRRKLREITHARGAESGAAEESQHADILRISDEIEPADRKLGDLLRSLELIDADTLAALWTETCRQRRSLRQVLLAGGFLTLYQMALIETGNVDGLVLGPHRIIDRVRVSSCESVFHVFDPQRGHEALLRHLSEAEMEDAVHPDEFRQRFSQAALVQHPNLLATFEVLEIAGRPAALQEWVRGVPSTDWPAVVSRPGVWLRLLGQASRALQAVHQAGLVHGHLRPDLLLLSADGVLKVSGLGEPPWLRQPVVHDAGHEDVTTDVFHLGQIATAWLDLAASRKTEKKRSSSDPVLAIIKRLSSENPQSRYPDLAALLEEIDRALAKMPESGEEWQQLLVEIRDSLGEGSKLRRAA